MLTRGDVAALGCARVRFTCTRDGDMADPTGGDPAVAGRRMAVVDRPWTWLSQVHGARAIIVDRPGAGRGEAADAAVSAAAGVALCVLTADCAPVAFSSPEGVIGVAHAGWRGLVAGVIEETVTTMRSLGATTVWAALGPCVHPECYAFGKSELDHAVLKLGASARAETAHGQPALDVPSAVRGRLAAAGADLVLDADVCTACSPEHWSWRARGNQQRQATVVWQA